MIETLLFALFVLVIVVLNLLGAFILIPVTYSLRKLVREDYEAMYSDIKKYRNKEVK